MNNTENQSFWTILLEVLIMIPLAILAALISPSMKYTPKHSGSTIDQGASYKRRRR